MSLDKISAQLATKSASNKKSLPPVESWNPPYCGEIDIQIKANGDWFYGGSIFKRLPLVKLFASVLIMEVSKEVNNNLEQYFLVTPVEKVKIKVDDAPFVLTQWHWLDEEKTIMQVSTNLDDEFILDAQHPLIINKDGDLYVTVRRNLTAKVHRNVYYQWVDIAKEQQTKNGTELIITSANCQFSLGTY
ncbi:DUF1285 domain-containing protein [Colwellia piezophila]|uniref:DUF1285 domain-containing protein n=1 Tax=Colwellia piezophila TaxID=211668 RepID=UPI00036164F9|nr:DUF1285 domain-containing protein [Colwellia piezophila]